MIAVSAAKAIATVGDGADTEATVGDSAQITIPGSPVTVTAVSANAAVASAAGNGGGAIDIKVISTSATVEADTLAELTGNVGTTTTGLGADGLTGTLGVAGASTITVQATGQDRTTSRVDTTGGGLIAVNPSSANATTSPHVEAKFGSGNITASGAVSLIAESHTDADAFVDSTQGGLVDVQLLSTNATADPDVDAEIAGGLVQSGTTLTIQAVHGGDPPDLSDGTITGTNTTSETLTFDGDHGLSDADTVIYDGPTMNGVVADHRYSIIVTATDKLRLGVQFTPSTATVDADAATLVFTTAHNFESGDRVRYEATAGDEILGLTAGTVYEVVKVDAVTIKLKVPGAASPQQQFDPSTGLDICCGAGIDRNIASGTADDFYIPGGHGFSNNQAVTYHAPTPFGFTADMVDVNIVFVDPPGDAPGAFVPQRDSNGNRVHVAGNNNIYLPDHGLGTGTIVQYRSTGTPLSGLVNGGYYEVINDGSAAIKLRPVGGGATINIASSSSTAIHTLVRAGQVALGGLTDGDTYYVQVLDANRFQLRTRPTPMPGIVVNLTTTIGVPTSVDASGSLTIWGTHTLRTEAIPIFADGTGTQRLVIDITGSLNGQKMIGVGGPRSVIGGAGDEIATSTSTGVGGGFVTVRNSQSDVTSSPTVNTNVNGGTLRAQDIVVSAQSQANIASVSSNEGGGFVDVGNSRADGVIDNVVSTTIADSANLVAGRDVKILATGAQKANGESSTDGGGFVSVADANSKLTLSHSVIATISGRVFAVRTLLAEARDGMDATVRANADTGGLGADSDANDDGDNGIHVDGTVRTAIGGTASLFGSLVYLSASAGGQRDIDAAGVVIDAPHRSWPVTRPSPARTPTPRPWAPTPMRPR